MNKINNIIDSVDKFNTLNEYSVITDKLVSAVKRSWERQNTSGLDLEHLETKLDQALEKETPESLNEFIEGIRNNG